MKKKIVVLFGGFSTEYIVSVHSAYTILSHLDGDKYDVIPVGITKHGDWYSYYGDYENVENDTWFEDSANCVPVIVSQNRNTKGILEFRDDGMKWIKIDAAFPMLHGKNGEDGTVQGLFELAGIPLVGCDTLSSAVCMDKYRAHVLVEAAGIPAPKAVIVKEKLDEHELLALTGELRYPLFVKPVRAGSSFGITKIHEKSELEDAVNFAFEHDFEVIVEESVPGFEVGCAILGKRGSRNLIIGRADEIELQDGFLDYTEKYTTITSKTHMPARIDSETEKRIQDTAKRIYDLLGCSIFARVDMFLTPEKEIYFNEVNTIPGFTSHSRYPTMLRGIGMTFEDIVNKMVEVTFED